MVDKLLVVAKVEKVSNRTQILLRSFNIRQLTFLIEKYSIN